MSFLGCIIKNFIYSLSTGQHKKTRNIANIFREPKRIRTYDPGIREVRGHRHIRASRILILFLYQYLQFKLIQCIMQQFSLFRLYSGFIHQIISLWTNIKTQLTRSPATSWEARSTTSNWCRYIRLIDILTVLPRLVVRETSVEIYENNSYLQHIHCGHADNTRNQMNKTK